MLVDRGIVRVGVEIEVPVWDNGSSFATVARELIDAGYMLEDPTGREWTSTHSYGCTCAALCGKVRSGDVFIPPLVSLTYDASLPESGGEFVTSPVLLLEDGLGSLREIWEIITRDAVWTDQLPNRRGNGNCSPSIHLHVSATDPEPIPKKKDGKLIWREMEMPTDPTVADDYTHALVLYGPEMLQLASTCGISRGLFFRKPVRKADQRGHHGIIHVRNVKPKMLHIEWRLFEAAYDNWPYVEASAYFAAGLTRALKRGEAFRELMGYGYMHAYDQGLLDEAVREDNVVKALELVDPNRLNALRDITVRELDDDARSVEMVRALFGEAERMMEQR